MPTSSRTPKSGLAAAAVVVLAAIVGLAACSQKSPEEQVAEERGRYKATLNGFLVQPQPDLVAVDVEAAPAGGEAEAAEPAAEDEPEMVVEELPPPNPDVLLDILVQHDSNRPLAGVTVDVSMVDSAQVEKGAWKVWVDTSGLKKGNHLQVTHVLKGVDYAEGDGFFVEVRNPIPAAERGEYREFSSPG